jgi:hypothetical protein
MTFGVVYDNIMGKLREEREQRGGSVQDGAMWQF